MQTRQSSDYALQTVPLKEALLELVWPTRCAGCESLGELLCQNCAESLKSIATTQACSRCGAPYGQIICTECYSSEGPEQFSFSQAVCALEFEPISARMVVLYKNGNEHRLASLLAGFLFEVIPKSWLTWAHCISWIPVDHKTLRRRGFDHMKVIAAELEKLANLPALALLSKKPVKDQRDLGRQQRRQNLQDSFYCSQIQPDTVNQLYTNVILVDDVLTTGASLDIAAQTLLANGVKEVRAAAFARVW